MRRRLSARPERCAGRSRAGRARGSGTTCRRRKTRSERDGRSISETDHRKRVSREVVERQSRILSFTTLAVLSGVALAAIGVLALISIGWSPPTPARFTRWRARWQGVRQHGARNVVADGPARRRRQHSLDAVFDHTHCRLWFCRGVDQGRQQAARPGSVCKACGRLFTAGAARDLIGDYVEIEIPPVTPCVSARSVDPPNPN